MVRDVTKQLRADVRIVQSSMLEKWNHEYIMHGGWLLWHRQSHGGLTLPTMHLKSPAFDAVSCCSCKQRWGIGYKWLVSPNLHIFIFNFQTCSRWLKWHHLSQSIRLVLNWPHFCITPAHVELQPLMCKTFCSSPLTKAPSSDFLSPWSGAGWGCTKNKPPRHFKCRLLLRF